MLFKIALVLLVAWVAGTLGIYDIGEAVHALLLAGLLLVLLSFARARDAAAASRRGPDAPRS
jgi:hypothetical protein